LNLNQLKVLLYRETSIKNYRLFKTYYLMVKKNLSISNIIKDRLELIIRILIMPLFIRLNNQTKYDYYIIDKEDNYLLRKSYILNYSEIKNKNIGLLDSNLKSKIYINSINDLYKFFKAYFYALFNILRISILPFNLSLLQLSNFYYLKVKLEILSPKKIYLFYSYLPQTYLLSLYASNKMKIEVDYIISNMINEYLRYSYFENIQLCFANKVYCEEYKNIKKIGWISDKNTKYLITGNEFLINKSFNKNKYSIGFFSSGYWARKEGLYADGNITALKNKEYENNFYSKIEQIILKYIIKFTTKHNLSLKIYLHPYEKRLIHTYSIYPPYWIFLDSFTESIFINDEKNDFYEPEVGVLLQSSIFYDRQDKELPTFCFQFKQPKNKLQIPLKYLDKYKIYGFSNLKSLEASLLKYFKLEQ